jgi:hypothetical protein
VSGRIKGKRYTALMNTELAFSLHEMLGSQTFDYEECHLLICDAMQSYTS